MLALSGQAITGLFTLIAGLGGAAVVGFFDWLGRKGDREAAERQRQADSADRREERRTADLAQYRDLGADVLGRVREFMTDVHPHRVTINYQRGTAQQVVEALKAKWEALREPLARLAVGHPSARARELADEIISGLHRTFNLVSWAVFDLERQAPFAETVQNAVKEWEQLNVKMKELREALHAVGPEKE